MLKRVVEEVMDLEKTDISKVENLFIGYNQEEFVLGFNQKDGKFQRAFTIQASKWQELIMLLFQAGVEFQKEYKVDIGFSIEDEENAEDNAEE